MEGDSVSAQRCWRRACHLQPTYQWKLLPVLAERLPAEQVPDFVPLDFDGLVWLARRELTKGEAGAQAYLIKKTQKEVESTGGLATSADAWVTLFELYGKAKLPALAEPCMRNALALAPERPDIRVRLVRSLLEESQWDAAFEQSREAQERFPAHAEIQSLHDVATERKRSVLGTTPRPGVSQSSGK
jgi:hypothetical protein